MGELAKKQRLFQTLEGFFEPRSVAVVGATADSQKGGYALVANLLSYCGERLYPVNPKYREICGRPCSASVQELPEAVDLAILFVPAKEVPNTIAQCGKRGISRVMIQSAGFAETGEPGRMLQERCLAEARSFGIRLWGPNCMGVLNGHTRMVASFMRPHVWEDILRPGDVSVVVQSGMASAGFLMQVMSEGYFGLSKACSIGNRSDINECDLLEYFAEDQHTAVVAMYLESVSDPPRFRKAVEKLGKPLLLLRGGVSQGGAEAARSHTGTLAGNAGVAEHFFRQLSIERAYDFLELMDLTKALSVWKGKSVGKKVAVVTFSGAAGIVASDHLESHGMALAQLSRTTCRRLKEVFPPWMEPSNPVDIWPAIEKSGRERAYLETLRALVDDPGVEAIDVHMYVDRPLMEGAWKLLEPLASWRGRATLWLIGDSRCFRQVREKVEAMGIPVYGEIQRGIRALALKTRESRTSQS